MAQDERGAVCFIFILFRSEHNTCQSSFPWHTNYAWKECPVVSFQLLLLYSDSPSLGSVALSGLWLLFICQVLDVGARTEGTKQLGQHGVSLHLFDWICFSLWAWIFSEYLLLGQLPVEKWSILVLKQKGSSLIFLLRTACSADFLSSVPSPQPLLFFPMTFPFSSDFLYSTVALAFPQMEVHSIVTWLFSISILYFNFCIFQGSFLIE